MSLLSFLSGKKKPAPRAATASMAKERLQLILINERDQGSIAPDYLPQLQKELIELVSKYVHVHQDDVQVHLEKEDGLEKLEVKIEMPAALSSPTLALV